MAHCPIVGYKSTYPLVCKGDANQFRPNYHRKPLTRKFYAQHDVCATEKITKFALKHEHEIEKIMNFDIRQERYAPLTENQMYGWLEHRALKLDQNDPAQRRQPRTADEVLQIQAEIWRIYAQNMANARK